MKVRKYHHSAGSKVCWVLNNIAQLVERLRVYGAIYHYFFAFFELEYILIIVKRLLFVKPVTLWFFYQVISHFNDMVIVINVTVDKGIKAWFKATM